MALYRVWEEQVWRQAYLVEADSKEKALEITNVMRFRDYDYNDTPMFVMDDDGFDYVHALPIDENTVVEDLDEND